MREDAGNTRHLLCQIYLSWTTCRSCEKTATRPKPSSPWESFQGEEGFLFTFDSLFEELASTSLADAPCQVHLAYRFRLGFCVVLFRSRRETWTVKIGFAHVPVSFPASTFRMPPLRRLSGTSRPKCDPWRVVPQRMVTIYPGAPGATGRKARARSLAEHATSNTTEEANDRCRTPDDSTAEDEHSDHNRTTPATRQAPAWAPFTFQGLTSQLRLRLMAVS